ncbi:Aste57867_23013 [Aphanomyces stellatus]|uniref:Aste57867_23013 protein n=1 Tax=Aphanomyces stellatus TaxID=120398 RepID=A0A485LNG6_9STRA|nr:hypothetical protein As57867_022942 [Aphanomyces stellatus]VFT99661.1 Aste57867_23013 [Aphanomyces stellatus]
MSSSFVSTVAGAMESIKKNSDDWQKRLLALTEIQKQFKTLENTTATVPPETWRELKPLKDVIQDLRSQIVKEVCSTLALMSKIAGDSMAGLARDLLPVLVEVRGGGNKVCGAYCGECVEILVSNIAMKGPTVRFFVEGVVESKNKSIRACCIVALTLILVKWSAVLDKSDVQQIELGLKSALYDASSTCRSHSLVFFQRFQQKFSKRAALLLSTVDAKVQRRLESLPPVALDSGSPMDPATTMDSNSNSVDENYFQEQEDKHDANADQLIVVDTEGDVDIGDRVCISEKELFGQVQYIGETHAKSRALVGHGSASSSITPKAKTTAASRSVTLLTFYDDKRRVTPGALLFPMQTQAWCVCPTKPDLFDKTVCDRCDDDATVLSATISRRRSNVSFDQLDATASISETDGPLHEAEAEDDTLTPAEVDEPPLKKLLDSMLDAQRGFLDFMFLNLNVEMDHLDVFQKSAAIASSADAITYCDQVRNICQEKIDAVSAFMDKIVEAQQKAMET